MVRDTPDTEENAVTLWFSAHFSERHPLLQKLHREGGELLGEVTVSYGNGLTELLGSRLVTKLGLPPSAQRCEMRVNIGHSGDRLLWSRFAGGQHMDSTCVPHGYFPDGYWLESTGNNGACCSSACHCPASCYLAPRPTSGSIQTTTCSTSPSP